MNQVVQCWALLEERDLDIALKLATGYLLCGVLSIRAISRSHEAIFVVHVPCELFDFQDHSQKAMFVLLAEAGD